MQKGGDYGVLWWNRCPTFGTSRNQTTPTYRKVNFMNDEKKVGNHSHVDYLIHAAQHSRYHAKHWFRYLRKMVINDKIILTQDDLTALLEGKFLTNFQKVTLKRAMTKGTPTYDYVAGLNRPCKLKNIEEFFRRNPNVANRREDFLKI